MGERPGSREFEMRLITAIIHDFRLREYVMGTTNPINLTEADSIYFFETIQSLRSKKKNISFFSVYEYTRTDTSISDERSTELCAILEPLIHISPKDPMLESIVDGVIPAVEDTVKYRLVEDATAHAVDLLESGKPDDILEEWDKAVRLAIFRKTNKSSFWGELEKVEGDITQIIDTRPGISTGIVGIDGSQALKNLDTTMFHNGVGHGQFAMLVADSNVGKTTMMLNIAVFQSLAGYNVDYYSLEMDLDYIKARMISILTGIPTFDVIKKERKALVAKKLAEVKEKYPNYCEIELFHYNPHTLTIPIIGHNLAMSHKEGRTVHSLMIDYLDLMASTRNYRDAYMEINNNAIEIRAIADEYDLASFSPSQTNRAIIPGNKSKMKTRQNIGGAYGKLATSDHTWIVNEVEEEVDTDYTKGGKATEKRHIIRFFQDKNRFGKRGVTLTMTPDYDTGRFFDCFPRVA